MSSATLVRFYPAVEGPRCPADQRHGPTVPARPRPDRAWCGSWFRCSRCDVLTLQHSPAMVAQLRSQGLTDEQITTMERWAW